MLIRLINFRCYSDATFKFIDGKFYYIGGVSGIGKTTIFEAIYWCLYGKLDDYIYGHRKDKNITVVELHHDGYVISRKREASEQKLHKYVSSLKLPMAMPLQLLTPKNTQLFGDQAQTQINSHFGQPESYISTSYVRQGELHNLFTSAPRQRMKLLNQIGFNGDDPAPIIATMTSMIKDAESNFKLVQVQYQAALEKFNTMIKDQKIDKKFALSEDVIGNMKRQMEDLRTTILSLRLECDETQKIEASRQAYDKMRQTTVTELASLPVYDEEEFNRLQDIKNDHDRQLEMFHLLEHRRAALGKFDTKAFTTMPPPIFTHEQLNESITQYRRCSEMRTRTAQVGIKKYDPDEIKNELEALQASIDYQWEFPILDEYRKMVEERDRLDKLVCKNITPEIVAHQEAILTALERTRDVLECPQCQTPLRHTSNGLVCSEDTKFDQETYLKAKVNLEKVKKHLSGVERLTKLNTDLETMLEPKIPKNARRGQISGFRSRLEQLTGVVYIPPPEFDASFMNQCIEWHAINNQVNELGNIEKPVLPEDLVEKINILKKAHMHRVALSHNLEQIEKQISTLPSTIRTVDEIKTEIANLMATGNSIKQSMQLSSITQGALDQYNILTNLKVEAGKIHQRLLDLQSMKQVAAEKECHILKTLVDSINVYLQHSAGKIFNDPMSIQVSLFKTIKRSGIEKPAINFIIKYKDGVFNSIRGVSGGEKMRISILMAAAFNRISGSKILILDESIANIGAEDKDKTIELLKETLKGRLVFMTCQDASTGTYDQILDLDNTQTLQVSPDSGEIELEL